MTPDARQFDRAPQAFSAMYRPYGALQQGWRVIQTLDVSATGIRFECPEPLEEETRLEVKLEIPSCWEPLILQGHVVWCRAGQAGAWEIGYHFTTVTPQDSANIDLLVQFLRQKPPTS